jgi:hypothetical protein
VWELCPGLGCGKGGSGSGNFGQREVGKGASSAVGRVGKDLGRPQGGGGRRRDMNAYSSVWNPRANKRRNATFWEDLIERFGLVIWNSEQGTRSGSGSEAVTIIVLTISTPGVTLNWYLLRGEATGSDHEVIC